MKLSSHCSTKGGVVGSAAFVLTLLGGCAVGPNFHAPELPAAQRYTPDPLPSQTVGSEGIAGQAQSLVSGAEVPQAWWQGFGVPALDHLVQSGLQNNPSLKAAQAALAAAREQMLAGRGALLPALDASLGATRNRANNTVLNMANEEATYNIFNAQVSASYAVDLFGRQRRIVEALDAQREFRQRELQVAQLTLAADIVSTAVTIASLHAQISVTENIAKVDDEVLTLQRKQLDLGQASKVEVLSQQAELDETLATLPPLRQQLSDATIALAVLTGQPPERMSTPSWQLQDLHLPKELPVSVPSQALARRPDVRAQEALVHAASAHIGVATADLLPQLAITADFGTLNNRFSDLLRNNFSVWSIGGNLLQPVFHGGQLVHERRAAVDVYEQSVASYQATVLSAFQNVAEVLVAIQNDAERVRLAGDAASSAEQSLTLARQSYAVGGTSYLQLLDAQRTAQRARLTLARAQAARFTDSAALFQALAGGW